MRHFTSSFVCLPCVSRQPLTNEHKSPVTCCAQSERRVSKTHTRRAFLIFLGTLAASATPDFFSHRRDGEETLQDAVIASAIGVAKSDSTTSEISGTSSTNNSRTYDGKQTASGIIFVDFEEGEGSTPKWGDFVYIQYKLYTVDSTKTKLIEHDSSINRVKKGYFVHHGNGEHILGLEEMLHSMRRGGFRRCVIPSRLAYFKPGFAPIPTNARARRRLTKALNEGDGNIVMDIQIVSIEKDPEDRGYYSDLVPTDEELLEIMKNLKEEHPDPRLRSFTVE